MDYQRKILDINRDKSTVQFRAQNNDLYDACAALYNFDGTPLWNSQYISTRATNGYNGGQLSKGTFWGIVDYRDFGQMVRIRVIKLFDAITNIHNIKTAADIPEEAYALKSDIQNPNHGGAYYVSEVQIHPGGITQNYSHACQTILNTPPAHEFDNLMIHFNDNEILIVQLK